MLLIQLVNIVLTLYVISTDPLFAAQLFGKYTKEVEKQISHCINTNVPTDKGNASNQSLEFDKFNESDDKENRSNDSPNKDVLITYSSKGNNVKSLRKELHVMYY